MEINKLDVMRLNEHIIVVSGLPGEVAGLNSENNLDFAIEAANTHEKVINQATDFMYYANFGHAFLAANKRTSWEVIRDLMAVEGSPVFTSQMDLMAVEGSPVFTSQREIIGMCGSVATGKFGRSEIRTWIEDHVTVISK